MLKVRVFILLSVVFSVGLLICEGFYKDLFMDGGCHVYNYDYFYSADSLGLDWEFLATENQALQDETFISNEWNENGVLLYPDGAPRFRTIYTNGGSATSHGNSMGPEGRQRIRDYYAAGGSYTGSCAGAFIASISYQTSGIWEAYYHIWPGRTASTGLSFSGATTGHFIEPGSALLDYYDFGGDLYVDDISHRGGCYANTAVDWPEATEILARYDYPPRMNMHNQPSCWAYKADEQSGRIVVTGSHPEDYTSGERLHKMNAILLYALDGIGLPVIKAELERGIWRDMDRSTSDEMPEYTKIGDKQYHHFTIEVPIGQESLYANLEGDFGYHFNLYLNRGDFAFRSTAEYADTAESSSKTITVPYPEAGTWYVGVELYTTVVTSLESWGYDYIVNQEVLNGISYSILAGWDSITGIAESRISESDRLTIAPNPFRDLTQIDVVSSEFSTIEIFDQNGRMVISFAGYSGSVQWDGNDGAGKKLPNGVYIVKMENSSGIVRQTVMLAR